MSFWAKLARFTSLRDGQVPASGGGTSNFLRADGTWASPGASSAQASPQYVTTGNTFTVPASQQCVCADDVIVDGELVCDGVLATEK